MSKIKKSAKKKPATKKTAKKIVRKVISKNKSSEGKPVGRIIHYFSDISVAVVNLTAPIKIGDEIRIIGGKETDFEQKISSMQIEREGVKSAKKGDSVGMKVEQKVHEGYKVYRV